MMASNCAFAVRDSLGTFGLDGPPTFSPVVELKREAADAFTFISPDKSLYGICTNSQIEIFRTRYAQRTSVCVISQKALAAKFSAKGGYVNVLFESTPGSNNFEVWDIGTVTGVIVHSLKVDRFPDLEFFWDEKICALWSNNAVSFFNLPNFEKAISQTPGELKIAKFSISPLTDDKVYLLCFIRATTGPSFTRIYSYPNFDKPVSSKSFFQASRVKPLWSPDGRSVLIITAAEIDKTKNGEPIYGNTLLHYMNIKGDNASIQTGTESNAIHAAEWSPTSKEFCFITGSMPHTRAVLMNNSCDKIFETPLTGVTGHSMYRKIISFNPQGNLMLLCTYGIKEKVEVWEIKTHKKRILVFPHENTTHLLWLNDGVHFISATMSPQIRNWNGFKVWDFTGKCLKEWKADKNLFDITPFLTEKSTPFPFEKLDSFVKKSAIKSTDSDMSSAAGDAGNNAASKEVIALSDNQKKIRALQKKIGDIAKLKEALKEGKKLEKNQLDKIEGEAALIVQLKALELS